MIADDGLPAILQSTLTLVGLVAALGGMYLSLKAITLQKALVARLERVSGTNVGSQLRIEARLIELTPRQNGRLPTPGTLSSTH